MFAFPRLLEYVYAGLRSFAVMFQIRKVICYSIILPNIFSHNDKGSTGARPLLRPTNSLRKFEILRLFVNFVIILGVMS